MLAGSGASGGFLGFTYPLTEVEPGLQMYPLHSALRKLPGPELRSLHWPSERFEHGSLCPPLQALKGPAEVSG